MQVLPVLCGVWSLDFFRSVIPPFCVSSNIKTVHILVLQYLVAFYLILITYSCIKLHDNNFRPVESAMHGSHFTDVLFNSLQEEMGLHSAVPSIGAGAAVPPRELEFVYPARLTMLITMAVLLFASLASQTHTPARIALSIRAQAICATCML